MELLPMATHTLPASRMFDDEHVAPTAVPARVPPLR
jgi:hypothetical protein